MARLAEALATIQSHTGHRLLFPTEITAEHAMQIINAARILSGQPVSITWSDGFRVDRDPQQPDSRIDFAVGDKLMARIVSDLTIELNNETIVVGRQMSILEGRVTEFSDAVLAAAVPVEGSESWLVRYDGDEETNRVSTRPV